MDFQPKYKHVKDLVKRDINLGKFPDGSFLPPECELMSMFKVSRNTIRAAIKDLRAEGVVSSRQGRQSIVNAGALAIDAKDGVMAWIGNEYVDVEGVYFEIFKHVCRRAAAKGMRVDYINLQFPDALESLEQKLSAYKGVAITGGITRQGTPPGLFEALSGMGNVVAVDNTEGLPTNLIVGTDNYAGAVMAVDHLAAKGRRKVAFLGISNAFYVYRPFSERLRGYRDAVAKRGLSDDPGLVVTSSELRDTYDIRSVLRRTLDKHPDIDAFFAISDFIAVQALYALRGMDVNVPHDISVMGFDGLPTGETVSPRLTTVAQPFEEIAGETVSLIAKGAPAKGGKIVPVKPILVARESA